MVVFKKVEHAINIQPSNSAPRYSSQRIENVCLHKHLCIDVHGSVIYNSQSGKTLNVHQLRNG